VTKAVFTTKAGSGYDDIREERYHFPKQYLARVQQTIGDLIVYYEPRRSGGALSYVAVARVDSVDPDPKLAGHYYARMSQYLEFDNQVPFRGPGGLFERGLESDGKTGLSGDFRNAVRLLPDHEFEAILAAGFSEVPIRPMQAPAADFRLQPSGFADEQSPFDYERPYVERVVSRPFRDEAFARHVKEAYKATCAFTGLSMRNGGGRTEVDAAHIKPVGNDHNGPDSVRNGLALSKTVHWMFDRGLLSVDSDFKILTAKGHVPEPIRRLIHPSGYLTLPDAAGSRPHPAFLEYHRNRIFKDAKV
jgi:putative restriction endonuclease